MPVSVIVPISAKWLKDQGYIFPDGYYTDSSKWSFDWDKSLITIEARNDKSKISGWLQNKIPVKEVVELVFYPSIDSVEIEFSVLNKKRWNLYQDRLNDLAARLDSSSY